MSRGVDRVAIDCEVEHLNVLAGEIAGHGIDATPPIIGRNPVGTVDRVGSDIRREAGATERGEVHHAEAEGICVEELFQCIAHDVHVECRGALGDELYSAEATGIHRILELDIANLGRDGSAPTGVAGEYLNPVSGQTGPGAAVPACTDRIVVCDHDRSVHCTPRFKQEGIIAADTTGVLDRRVLDPDLGEVSTDIEHMDTSRVGACIELGNRGTVERERT